MLCVLIDFLGDTDVLWSLRITALCCTSVSTSRQLQNGYANVYSHRRMWIPFRRIVWVLFIFKCRWLGEKLCQIDSHFHLWFSPFHMPFTDLELFFPVTLSCFRNLFSFTADKITLENACYVQGSLCVFPLTHAVFIPYFISLRQYSGWEHNLWVWVPAPLLISCVTLNVTKSLSASFSSSIKEGW